MISKSSSNSDMYDSMYKHGAGLPIGKYCFKYIHLGKESAHVSIFSLFLPTRMGIRLGF